MKHLLLPSLLVLSIPVLGQNAKLAQYCILEAQFKAKNQAALELITGADPAATSQTEEVSQVASMKYEADALNYLSSHGWELVDTGPLTYKTGGVYGARYYLRRKP